MSSPANHGRPFVPFPGKCIDQNEIAQLTVLKVKKTKQN